MPGSPEPKLEKGCQGSDQRSRSFGLSLLQNRAYRNSGHSLKRRSHSSLKSCNCYGWTDTPFVNSIGVLASHDPVAVDKACIDMMNEAPGLINSEAEEFDALAPGSKKLNLIKGKDIEQQVYGGVENRLGVVDYVIEKVPLDRSQAAIAKFYPEGVRAKRLKPMYEKIIP